MDPDWVDVFSIEHLGFPAIGSHVSFQAIKTKKMMHFERNGERRCHGILMEKTLKKFGGFHCWSKGAFAKGGVYLFLEGEKDMKRIGIVLVKCWVIEDATATGANWNRQGREVFCMTGDSHTYQDASNYLTWKCPLFFLTDYHLFVTNAAEKSAYMGTSFAAAQRLVDE